MFQEVINAGQPVNQRKRVFHNLSDFTTISVDRNVISGTKRGEKVSIPLIAGITEEVAGIAAERLANGQTVTREDIDVLTEKSEE